MHNIGEESDAIQHGIIIYGSYLGHFGGEAGGSAGLQESVRCRHDAREQAKRGRRKSLRVLADKGFSRDGKQSDDVQPPGP
jgi:hypothetical protein